MEKAKTGTKPFGMADRLGYMFGDFGNDFTFILSSMFLMKFYTDVMGVSSGLVGLMMMVARIVDAFTDVAMGQICDRSKSTAKGKFTPWIRRVCGPVALASFLMYAVWFKDMAMGFKIFWMFFTYLLWGSICYTGINIPYGSMASAITDDPKERASLSTFRTIGGTLATTVIGVVLPLVVYYTDTAGNTVFSGERMCIAALCCSISAIVCYMICYHLTTERVKIETKTEKFSLGELVKTMLSNRALIGIVIAALMLLLAQLTLGGMGNYIYPNYFGNAGALSMATMLQSVVTLLLSTVIVKVSSKIGKKELATTGAAIGAIALFVAYFLHTKNVWIFVGLYLVSSIGIAFFNLLCWAMITDVIDDAEVKSGSRSDGTIYAVYSFARKLGQATSSGLIGGLLSLIGYSAATAFDPAVTNGIYNITCLVPASYNDLKEGPDFRDHYGWVFYQRMISMPAFAKSQRIMLRMAAVTHKAKIYLNGDLICEHKGGFLPFEVEITDKLQNGDNLLTIAVDNVIDYTTLPVGGKSDMMGGMMGFNSSEEPTKPQNNPNFDFFNYCGITRPVKIYTTPKNYIADITVVPHVNGADASLTYCIDTVGEGSCLVEVFDRDGNKVAESQGTEGTLEIKDVTLWQPLHAYLYDIKVTFGEDVYTLPYGVRTVRVEGTKFLINEKPFYFKGYGKHEDTFPAGRGINLPMNTKDISIMKWQGANSFRTSHYPYSEEMMRLCDEEGIVVIDETTAVGVNLDFGGGANFNGQKVHTFDKEHGVQTQEHHKDVIRDLISRDKNHACVVMWSIANEPDSYSEGAYDYFAPLYELARSLDPQKRPCTLVSVQMGTSPETDCSAKLSDVICLNRYYGWYFGGPDLVGPEKALRQELDSWKKVGKPVVFTEYGADTVMGLHDTTPVMYTEEYQVDYYKMNNAVFDDYDFVVGEQAWNFADFATSQSMLRVQGNKKGLFTRDRKPKMVAHYFKERWHNIPDFDYKK